MPATAPTWRRRAVTASVVWASRWWMQRRNHVDTTGAEALPLALARGRGVLTFSNHVSLFDDPLLTSCIAGGAWEDVRWIGADAQNFFGDRWRARLFAAGKCVPIERGAGLDQPGMHFLAERLSAGDWVHLFPEGGRSRDPGRLQLPLKAGLGALVRDARPLLLPFVHRGMHEVLPIGARVPRQGHAVRLRFGPLTDSDEGLADQTLEDITTWATDTLVRLFADIQVT
jgi:monolysocardiolipin acyltransferase